MGIEGAPQERIDDVEKAEEMAIHSDSYRTAQAEAVAAGNMPAAEGLEGWANDAEELAAMRLDFDRVAQAMSDEELETALTQAEADVDVVRAESSPDSKKLIEKLSSLEKERDVRTERKVA